MTSPFSTARIGAHPEYPRRRSMRTRRLVMESLEDRLAPAIFSGAGPNLAIDLNTINEVATFSTDGITVTVNLINGTANTTTAGGNVSGNGTSTATFLSSVYTGTITITDSVSNTGVGFAHSTGAYPQSFGITLNSVASGNVTFAGSSTFGGAFTVNATAGFIASDLTSSFTQTNAAFNVTMSAAGDDILMKGAFVSAGDVSFTSGVLQADNVANDFAGVLQINGAIVSAINDANALDLAGSSLAFSTLNQTTHITAGGNITQSGTLTTTGTGTLAFASSGGSITLGAVGNSFSASTALGLAVTGTNSAGVFSSGALQLADVTLGTGPLALTASGSITQQAGTTIETGGALSLTADTSGNIDLLLANAGNRVAGAVTVAELGGGDVRDISLRNSADGALPPTGTPLTTASDVRNLTLFFDNNGVTLPGYNISNNLSVTAGGDITQSAALTVPGTTSITVLGDFGITLTQAANTFTGAVSLIDPQSTQPVSLTNSAVLVIGTSNLGRGTFNATAATGNITQAGPIVQEKGAAPATFTVTAGTTVTLANNNNFLTGGQVFAGAGLTNVNVRNADFMAKFSDLTLPATVTDLTVRFNNASIALPSLTLNNLNVNAQGIVQQSGTALIVSNNATFNANAFALNLSNAGNNFTDLEVDNSGRNDVAITDTNDLNFTGTSNVGSSRLTINAGGNLTDSGGGSIVQAALGAVPSGDVRLASAGGSITLDRNNQFRGPVSVTVSGANTVTLTNSTVPLTLGNVTTGTGAFTALAGPEGIVQDPNSVLNLGGISSFTAAGGAITLNNRTNTFTGAVGLSGSSSSLRAMGAIVLSASVPGPLNVKTGGLVAHSITQTGAITGNSTASFDAGAGNVTLTTGANNFSSVSVFSTGNIAITDTNALNVGTMRVGAGTLALTASSLGTAAGGSIVQTTGTGALTLDTAGGNITLNSALNDLRGTVNVVNGNTANLRSVGDLTFMAGSTINGALTANSGGILTLPTVLTNLGVLTVSALSTTIGTDVTTSGSQSYTGTVAFTGNRILTAAGNVNFRGDVNAGGTVAITAAANGFVQLNEGTWNQGANALTINGVLANLMVGDSLGVPARFIMTGGTIDMAGNGIVQVLSDGTFQVGSNSAAQETVAINNGSGALTIDGALAVGFGTPNDKLLKTGSGNITLGATAQLVGSGLAGVTASPVLETQTALLVGHFANSVDATDSPRDFFAGSDIVTPAYDFTQVAVMSGGTLAPTGIATGFLPDGDKYTVKSSLGAAAGLATVEDVAGRLNVVVRNTTAAGASTLTISTTGGGDGQLPIGGLMVHAPGSVAVSAATSNFIGMFTTIGALTSLTSRDLGTAVSPFSLTDGGAATVNTSIISRIVQNTTATLAGALGTFRAVSATGTVNLTAQKFGTLTTTGGPVGTNPAAPGLPNPGDFDAKLTSATTSTGTVVTSATVAGTLGGIWDVRGIVGTVKAFKTTSLTLGTLAAANMRNGGLLTGATSLNLGPVTGTTINATGAVKSLTTSDVGSSTLVAGSFGTVKVSGNTILGLVGNFNGSTLRATGNAAGVALKSLSIAGDLSGSSFLNFLDGDVTSIAVTRTVTGSTITATDTGMRGNLKSIAAGKWQNTPIDARSVGSLKINGNLTAGLFGDFTGSTVTARGNALGVGLGTFDAKGTVGSSNFNIQNGNLTTFKAGRQIGSTSVQLTDAAFGTLGTIQAGDWISGVIVLAETIGTLASVGAAAVNPASPLLLGGFNTDTITAYQNTGTVAAIGRLTAKGDFASSTVNAERGLGLVSVGRTVSSSTFISDDSQVAAINVGRIPSLTAGAWNTSSVSVNTFGTVKITGYLLPESSSASFQNGDVTGGTFLAHGATPTTPTGISTFTVARHFQTNSFLNAPFGIKTLTVGGRVQSTSQIVTDNPANPTAGFLATTMLGEVSASTIRAGSLSTLKVIGSVPFALLGNISGSTIAVNSTTPTIPPTAIGTLSATGDFSDSVLDAPNRVGTISVTGRITALSGVARVQAGYSLFTGGLGSLTAGAWGQAGINLTTDFVTRDVGTFNLKGNTARGFAGTADRGFIDILSNLAGVGLGTFSATGTANNSLFRVSDGDVTSFSVLRFASSDLLVGFRPVKGSDISLDPVAANWSVTNHRIGSFKTTAPFSATDADDSTSFVDSNVVAAILQNVTLTGVNPASTNSTKYGLAFRTTGGSAGTVIIEGAIETPSFVDGQFNLLGLPG